MLNPCKDCEDRHPHCHSECDLYAQMKAERDAAMADLRQKKAESREQMRTYQQTMRTCKKIGS